MPYTVHILFVYLIKIWKLWDFKHKAVVMVFSVILYTVQYINLYVYKCFKVKDVAHI